MGFERMVCGLQADVAKALQVLTIFMIAPWFVNGGTLPREAVRLPAVDPHRLKCIVIHEASKEWSMPNRLWSRRSTISQSCTCFR
jgi:hypothetical protein